jgi:hypothetical protein
MPAYDGQVVDRDVLMEKVWPDSFVEEGNLKVIVFKLRKALGEAGGGDQYIETVPRRGYRFAAKVLKVDETAGELALERRKTTHVLIEKAEIIDQGEELLSIGERSSRSASLRDLSPAWKIAGICALLLGAGIAILYSWSTTRTLPVSVRSIAVLPFKSLNTSDGDEYLGLGLADALITRLGQHIEPDVMHDTF